ncbi:holo-ACP synthase [Streptococcus gallinaceus]|uniref:Holo-[acyl-carrier-protein] synthase n=1 Tax=Streptococcus gallinaceus TaxID=165758 RepID=A0ABV2JL71_9STRE|nr:holo-ACP synthase [Streptococcus gallinaceus]MCP1639710.1 holo-[acyl-carrier protein] synthase [Streptococcus gallinaceus]MCP1770493.1 holo-[acyl-carrier protein] synthase [Streptococcus gallinaceus]
MIIGHGIDLQDISAIESAYVKRPRFAEKVLTLRELERFHILSGKRKIEYLAGRWAAKEAFSKAWGTGIGSLGFHDIEILNDEKGVPYVNKSPFNGKAWLSISHSGQYVQASLILEEEDES